MVDCGDVVLKEYDPRFFPKRRIELDTYSVIISDPALNYGGSLFYEYHKSFTAFQPQIRPVWCGPRIDQQTLYGT